MAKLTVGNGLTEYIAELEKVQDVDSYLGKVVYEGASVVNGSVESALAALPVDDTSAAKGEKRDGIRSIEKEGLINGYGITKMKNEDGYLNVKLGFDGYNKLGKPNALIARSVISGTSFLKKNDFMSKATKSAKAESEEAMKLKLESEIGKLVP